MWTNCLKRPRSRYDALERRWKRKRSFVAVTVRHGSSSGGFYKPRSLKKLIECKSKKMIGSWPRLISQAEEMQVAYSPRLDVFKKISLSPGGLKFLLDFRGDLLSVIRHGGRGLEPLDSDIVFLFEMWFQEGFLYLEEITLNSAFRQIALIKDRDLVHPMASIEEMGLRLG